LIHKKFILLSHCRIGLHSQHTFVKFLWLPESMHKKIYFIVHYQSRKTFLLHYGETISR
jgi:hypothetical protein